MTRFVRALTFLAALCAPATAFAAAPAACDLNDMNDLFNRRHAATERKSNEKRGIAGMPLTEKAVTDGTKAEEAREAAAAGAAAEKAVPGVNDAVAGELTRLQAEAKARGLDAAKPADSSVSRLTIAPAAKDGTYTRRQKEFLKAWGNQSRDSFGPLLTPPVGKIDEKIAAAHRKVDDIIHKLAGERLAAADYHVVTNIYDSVGPNAHMANEKDMFKKFPFTGHRTLGIAKDGKPIYELAVTTSLLRMADNEDQLAFVLGHELSHLFQHHVDAPKEPYNDTQMAKQWWSGQQKEAVADHEGIKLLVGKYDLSGVRPMLEKLAALDKDPGDFTEFEDAASSHHQAGVRIALGEAAVEYLRKTDERAAQRAITALPEDFAPRAKPRERYVSDQFPEVEPKWQNYVRNHLLKDEPLFNAMNDKTLSKISQARAGDAQMKKAFLDSFDIIEKSRATKQAKVDATINSMFFFDNTMWGQSGAGSTKGIWESMTHAESDRVLRFIADNSVGKDAWSTETFIKKMSVVAPGDQVSGLSLYPMYFAKSTRMQDDFAKLTKTLDSWKDFVPKVNRATYEMPDGINFQQVSTMAREVMDKKLDGKAFVEEQRKQVLDVFGHVNMRTSFENAKDRSLFTTYAGVLDDLKPDNEWSVPNENFRSRIQTLMEPATDEYRKGMIRVFDASVKRKVTDDTFYDLREMIHAAALTNLSDAEKEKVADSLVKLAQGTAQEGLTKEIVVPGFNSLPPQLLDPAVRALVRPGLPAAERKNLLEFVLAQGAADVEKINPETRIRIEGFLAKYLPKDELVKTLEADSWSGIDKAMEWRLEKAKDPKFVKTFLMGEDPKQVIVDGYLLNRKRTLLDLVDNAPGYRERVFKLVSFQEFNKVLDSFDAQIQKTDAKAASQFSLRGTTVDFLMTSLFAKQDQAASFAEWKNAYDRIHELAPSVLEFKNSYAQNVQAYLASKWFPKMKDAEIYAALKDDAIRKALDQNVVADHLVSYVRGTVGDQAAAAERAKALRQVESDLSLVEQAPELRETFKQKYLAASMAQPRDLDTLYPDVTKGHTTTELTQSGASPLRGMSFAASLNEKQPFPERMKFLEYMLGRSDSMPKFVETEADRIHKIEPEAPVLEQVRNMRSQLRDSTMSERVLFVDSFMTGPRGMVDSKGGTEFLVSHLMESVDPANVKTGRVVADALLAAHQDDRSLALAYMIAQKSQNEGKALSESDLIAAGLLAHGTPGVKFGQYLGFTSQFKKYSAALEKFQDDASPLKYGEVLDLLNKRFDGKWPENLEVKELMGFGSVHVAVGVVDKTTGEEMVVSVLRDNIQVATKEDFRRFNTFLDSLAKSDPKNGDFTSFVGLSGLVEQSVGLEFDPEAGFQMQKRVFDRYDSVEGRVHIESVPAYSNTNGNLFMKKAEGITARKLLERDPATYKEVMSVMSDAEMNILLGAGKDGSPHPIPMHANPDFHDGQVVVDVKPDHIRAQILDFGQAVEISNAERMEALDLLRVVTKSESPEKSAAILNAMSTRAMGKAVFTPEQVKKVFDASAERMDVFIRLLSESNLAGYKMPIPEVHWVLAVNRQIVLGEKIGIDNAKVFRNLIATRKFGGSEDMYLRARSAAKSVRLSYREVKRAATGIATAVKDLFKSTRASDVTGAHATAALTDGVYRGSEKAAKVGVYEGIFDPPTAAHLAAAQAAREKLGLDELYVLVKRDAASPFDFPTRQKMAEAEFANVPGVKVIDPHAFIGQTDSQIMESIAAKNPGHTVSSVAEFGTVSGKPFGTLAGDNIRYAVLGKPEDNAMLDGVVKNLGARAAPDLVTLLNTDVGGASAAARKALAAGEKPEGLADEVAALAAAKPDATAAAPAVKAPEHLEAPVGKPLVVLGTPYYPTSSLAALEREKPAVAAAIHLRDAGERELADARRAFLGGKLSAREFVRAEQRLGRFGTPLLGAETEAALRVGALHQEADYVARRLAQARLDGDDVLSRQLKLRQAAVGAQLLGENAARRASLKNGNVARSARRGVVGALEQTFRRNETLFHGRPFAKAVADPDDLKLLTALQERESLGFAVGEREARSRLREVVSEVLVPYGAADAASLADRMTDDLIAMHAEGRSLKSLPKERWDPVTLNVCSEQEICAPRFQARPAAEARADLSAAARESRARRALAEASPEAAAEARAISPVAEAGALKAAKAELEADSRTLTSQLKKNPELQAVHTDTLGALSDVEADLRTLDAESAVVKGARELNPAEEKLGAAADEALARALAKGDSSLPETLAGVSAKDLPATVAKLAPAERAKAVVAIAQLVAKDAKAAAAGLKNLEKADVAALTKAFTRADELARAAGPSDGKLARSVYRDAGLSPSLQAIADKAGGSREKSLGEAARKELVAAEVKKVGAEVAERKKLEARSERAVASIAASGKSPPKPDFKARALDTLQGAERLDERQRAETADALARISAKDATRGDQALLKLRALAGNPDMFETFRLSYVHTAESFEKSGDWAQAWEQGVRKMLLDSDYSRADVDKIVDLDSKLKFYQQTAKCLLSG